jgi:hypothetical protein
MQKKKKLWITIVIHNVDECGDYMIKIKIDDCIIEFN